MAEKLTDISSSHHEEFSKEQMLKYLNGELSPEEQHKMEEAMLDSDLVNDAVEGLQSLGSTKNIPGIEQDINANLRKYLQKKKDRRSKRTIRELPWMYIFIVIILLLIIISFAVIKAHLR